MADDDETDNQPVVRKRIRKKRPSRATVPGRGRGQPRFQPTVSQRHTVTTLAGFHMTHDQMAMLILNEKTGKPISKNALEANFKEELRSGQSKVKMVMATKFMEIINQGNERAILWAMERIWKIPDPNRTDTRIGVAINDDGTPSDRRLVSSSSCPPAAMSRTSKGPSRRSGSAPKAPETRVSRARKNRHRPHCA